MSIWKLRLGLNPFTLLLSVIVGLVLVVTYFYMLSFLLGAGSPDQGPGSGEDGGRRRLLWGERAPASSFLCANPCALLLSPLTLIRFTTAAAANQASLQTLLASGSRQ
jgi:hypothetical protein